MKFHHQYFLYHPILNMHDFKVHKTTIRHINSINACLDPLLLPKLIIPKRERERKKKTLGSFVQIWRFGYQKDVHIKS